MTEESPRKKAIQPEMMVAVSAVFIGICALADSLYETQLMREEQRSAVLPLSLHADNVGIGPDRLVDCLPLIFLLAAH